MFCFYFWTTARAVLLLTILLLLPTLQARTQYASARNGASPEACVEVSFNVSYVMTYIDKGFKMQLKMIQSDLHMTQKLNVTYQNLYVIQI